MKADLYIRVSTDEQAEKGYSQRDQEERLRKYCDFKNIAVRRVIYEDYSAKSFNRPAWKEFLAEIKSKKRLVEQVLFTKWDRFSRNAADAFQMINTLRKYGVEPHAIEQPLDLDIPENKIMLGIYLTAPEVENDRRSLNVRYGMRRAVKEGRWMNGAPLGYINRTAPDGKKFIEIEQPYADIIKWAFETIAQRQLYVEHLFKEVKAKGLPCGKNHFWNILRNPVYCGKIFLKAYKDEPDCILKGNHEPIISESLFLEVQDYLNNRKKKFKTSDTCHPDLVLRGYLLCPNCQKPLTGSASRGRKLRYYYYHCIYPCRTRFKAEDTNQLFLKQLVKFNPYPGMSEVYSEIIHSIYKKQEANNGDGFRELKLQVAELQEKISMGREKFIADEISRQDYHEYKKKYEDQIDRIESQLFELSKNRVDIKPLIKKAVDNLSRLAEAYKCLDTAKRRCLIGSIFPEKMTFDGENFRTTRLNAAVELIFNVGKGLRQKKSGQNDEKIDLSTYVARPGFEPRHTEPKSVVLPLYYRAIRTFISEWGAKIGR